MLRRLLLTAALLVVVVGCGAAAGMTAGPTSRPKDVTPTGGPGEVTALPEPVTDGEVSLETALSQRRSVRAFKTRPLTEAELGQLLWAAQGITGGSGGRTAPSAGALYPLEVYVATADGLFHYDVDLHALAVVSRTDLRLALYEAAGRQTAVGRAPAVFVIAAVYERTAVKYGADRGSRYVHLEAGHAAQNLLLQAVALGLGAVPIGAFDDAGVQAALGSAEDGEPLYLIPVGQP